MRRFSKRKWIRLIDQLVAEAEYFDPGDPWLQYVSWSPETDAKLRRLENRHADFEYIAQVAEKLRDGLTTLRR